MDKAVKRPRKAGRSGAESEGRIRARNEEIILDAAVNIFSTKGYDGARVAEIASESGLPLPNLYYYFGSKKEIYRRVIVRLLHHWDHIIASNIVAEHEPAAAIKAYIRDHFAYTWQHRAETRLFATEMISGARFLSPRERQHVKDVTDEHNRIIEGWIKAGRLAPFDVRQLFMSIWASTQYFATYEPIVADTLEKSRLTERDFRAASEALARIVLDGILPKP